MTKAVIFDIDGTLVDSVDLHAQAWKDAFADFGHDLDLKAIREQIGKGGDQLLPVFLSKEEIEAKGKALEEHRGKVFKSKYMGQVKPFGDVRALFERLVAEDKRIALASSAKTDEVQSYKKLADITDLLDTETSSDDAAKSKPHPDIFQAAMDRLEGIEVADVVVIGDTPYDAEAASKAGIRTIGFTCGGWSEADLRGAGCIAIYRDPADLLANYADSPIANANRCVATASA